MEPILVYGFPLGSSMGLVAALEWLGQPYRLSRVDMLADMNSDAYGRLNGRRETPVLITDDGRVLTETLAIAGWLEARDVERRISFDPMHACGRPDAPADGLPEHQLYRRVQPVVGCVRTGVGEPRLSRDPAGSWPQGSRPTSCPAGGHDRRSPFLAGDRPTLRGRRSDRRRPLGRVP